MILIERFNYINFISVLLQLFYSAAFYCCNINQLDCFFNYLNICMVKKSSRSNKPLLG